MSDGEATDRSKELFMTGSFAPFEEDFLRITADVVWCTMTTVDRNGRPRSRVVHPIFTVADGQPVGWLLTGRTPVKSAHLARDPHVSCAYWSPDQNVVYADCVATWVEDLAAKRAVNEMFKSTPTPLGYDPVEFGLGVPEDATFTALRLDPWRIQVLRFAGWGESLTPRTWNADGAA
jgi:hypothetical protein